MTWPIPTELMIEKRKEITKRRRRKDATYCPKMPDGDDQKNVGITGADRGSISNEKVVGVPRLRS